MKKEKKKTQEDQERNHFLRKEDQHRLNFDEAFWDFSKGNLTNFW